MSVAPEPPPTRPAFGAPEQSKSVRLLDAAAVAEQLGVPESWVRREARANRLPHVQLGRYVRFELPVVEAFVVESRRGPVPGSGPGGSARG
jgi:excisionase family DNA binding protein